ncbi:hypothetical protein CAEBREN_22479 [Caenorhabditis brenneri]|uniref:Uncharacterized protein n=1 Tax=Caenorhabditis brenneri TaxID=135651 RepID=G0MFD2_CAEBE|nr:hypothetical protein CAEBREN_22479 [Caenorhabditis brenneri]
MSTGTDISSYDGGSESSQFSSARSPSCYSRSRLDSFLSSGSSRSAARRRPQSSGSRSGSSRLSTASGSSLKSILKKSNSKKKSTPRRRLSLPKKSKSPAKRSDVRPISQFSMIKNPVIRHQVRGFVGEYSKDPEFEAFSLSVDGIPFVALSLMNAEPELRERFKKAQPPTPMKKHTPGTNSPRKRLRHRSSSVNSKCVRFTDEGSSPKRAKKSLSAEDDKEFRELGETVSDAMIETDRQYNDLWNDRTNSVERQ